MKKNFKRAALIALAMSLAMPGTAAAGTWKESGKYKYYIDSRGKRTTGLKKIGKKYYYFDSKGRMLKSKWKTINGKKYYFRQAGYAATGLIKIGRRYYCFDSRGRMLKSTWKTINKSRYYFRKAGYAATGLVTIGKSTYLFRSNGKLYGTGLVTYNKKKYLLNNGRVLTGMQRYKGKLYYGTTKGLKTGWMTVNGKKYYFRQAGYAATGNLTINGKKYTFNASGVLTANSQSNISTPTNKPTETEKRPETEAPSKPAETEKRPETEAPSKPAETEKQPETETPGNTEKEPETETPATESPNKPSETEKPSTGETEPTIPSKPTEPEKPKYTYRSDDGFADARFYGKVTLKGGNMSGFGITTKNPYEVLDPGITFRLSNDCAQLYEMYTGSGNGYSYISASVYGRKPGTCTLTAYAGDGTIIDSCTIEVTSRDDDYFAYEAWKAKVKAEVWTIDMNDVQKIAAMGDYVLNHYAYLDNYAESSYYNFAYGIGCECWEAAGFIVDIARDLGYKADVYAPKSNINSDGEYVSNHRIAKVYIGNDAHYYDATPSRSFGDGITRYSYRGMNLDI